MQEQAHRKVLGELERLRKRSFGSLKTSRSGSVSSLSGNGTGPGSETPTPATYARSASVGPASVPGTHPPLHTLNFSLPLPVSVSLFAISDREAVI